MARPVLSSASQASTPKLENELVECPELGVDVLVWELNGTNMAAYRRGGFAIRNGKPVPRVEYLTDSTYLLGRAIQDENGNRIFQDGDLDTLRSWPNSVLERLAEVARELNNLNEGDDEEIEGNSEPEMTSGSTSI